MDPSSDGNEVDILRVKLYQYKSEPQKRLKTWQLYVCKEITDTIKCNKINSP